MPVKLNCAQCGVVIYRSPSRVRRRGNFCSGTCRIKFYTGDLAKTRQSKARALRAACKLPSTTKRRAYIALNEETFTVVSPEDYEWLSTWVWRDLHGYVHGGETGHVRMSRLIMERIIGRKLNKSELVDHENCNPHDNRRSNLRIASYSQNGANSHPKAQPADGLKGIRKVGRKWVAQIKVDRKGIYCGLYETRVEAAYIYDQFALQLFGEFARTNFEY